jgi:hypothetical protein
MPIYLPPPRVEAIIEAPRSTDRGSVPRVFLQDVQPTAQIPRLDLAIEVLGDPPLQTKFREVSRLLGLRQSAGSVNRRYPPTILELITLVHGNPARPRGRAWDSIHALTIRYHAEPRHVLVEYCIDYCDFVPETGAFHPRRKMVTYRATEELVEKRLDKKLSELKKYAEVPGGTQHPPEPSLLVPGA